MDSKGQSLIEVIVASLVGILVITALTFATIYSLRNANFAKTSTQATKLAQEGIERVRTGRDRGEDISDFQIEGQEVSTWVDDDLWRSISANCIPNCYFNVNSFGQLQYLAAGDNMPEAAETVGTFKRALILSDESNFDKEKKVTVIVVWADATGPHESKLETVLRRL